MLSQTTTQVQRQQQRLTPQQVQLARLTEMPVEALYDEVDKELKENPSLEAVRSADSYDDTDAADGMNGIDGAETTDGLEGLDSQDAPEAMETIDALDSTYSDPDDIPAAAQSNSARFEAVASDTQSFYDQLQEQIGFFNISDSQKELIEYLIGSLDERGWLPVSLQQVQDELEVYHNTTATIDELEQALHTLQRFEPSGIGARNLQECLLLQVRQGNQTDDAVPAERQPLLRLVRDYFELLMLNRWDKIAQRMHLTDADTHRLQRDLRRLNPRPGSAMGEAVGKSLQQITPDFIVETDYYGQITVTLNNGYVPALRVNDDDAQTLAAYDAAGSKALSRTERDAQAFLHENVGRAQSFIEALQNRQRSLLLTMRAIVKLQRPFFESGDETALRPMNLEDIAQQTGLHVSTVSRVTSSKWVQTTFGIYPLRFFFSSASQQDGEEVSVRKAEAALKEIIDHEDKQAPLSDDTIAQQMQQLGFDVARRTVSKYRDRLGIPVARMRKKSI